ncbi:MAG TPA: 6,7-dimethyl-8-ribityllumazine synthase [Verrucomicrobiae bacterium]|nr:6,7-dimethyl-8-ribityllumazine synthase [Verrucomicrobiae bacterium]
MLKPVARGAVRASQGKFAIVAAQYNREYTDALVDNAVAELKKAGAVIIEIIRVPGAFEVPVVAGRLTAANHPKFDVILCFGVILQGATSHAQNIAQSVSDALALLQIQRGVPIIHGVLHFENEEQARVRCLGSEHNRGREAARTALEMAEVQRNLKKYFRKNKTAAVR